jgi:exosome complex RNA-binding protein Rrp4
MINKKQCLHKYKQVMFKKGQSNIYIPRQGDIVLGIVVEKFSSHILIDCKAKTLAKMATLNSVGKFGHVLGKIRIGSLLCCMVEEVEETCTSFIVSCKENCPVLERGFSFNMPSSIAQTILSEHGSFLGTLRVAHSFQLAFGLNGLAWFSSKSLTTELRFRSFFRDLCGGVLSCY